MQPGLHDGIRSYIEEPGTRRTEAWHREAVAGIADKLLLDSGDRETLKAEPCSKSLLSGVSFGMFVPLAESKSDLS